MQRGCARHGAGRWHRCADTAGYPLRRRFAGADTGGPPPDGHGTPARGRDAPARAAGADRAALRADASGCLPRAANPAGRAVFRRGNARSGVGGAGGFQAPTFDRRLPAGALPAAPPVRPSARLRRRTERRTDAPARKDRALRLFRRASASSWNPFAPSLASRCGKSSPRGSFTAGSTESVWVRPSASCSPMH